MKKRIIIVLVLIIMVFIYSRYKMSQDNPDVLSPLIEKVENYIPQRDSIKLDVSKADVAWQLDHILKTINRIFEALEKSNPKEYSSSLNAMRIITMTSGYIPRGRAQSPDIVKPPEVIYTEDIYAQIKEAKENIIKLKLLDENSYFKHFVFGSLNRAQTIRFLEVHTNHHLKIIKDILQ
ncbi:DUF1569 domain-containing protein [Winogradskyella sp. A2]|uniref:DUF1569 domain-containing protein n=1 Tax=Winogradskyella sp. A2 TaxID=3366944 RepID=UPI00398C30E2